jgi:DNA (cytosine-5)-methyltransferase 1
MTHGSLFSGIGGFDLAAEWMGWENVFHCEWNEFGKKVLKYHFPKSISYDDITKTDFTIHRGKISVLSGGFPCQPYSLAGKRKGKDDERHLFPEMLRAIREIRPRWIVGENVHGIINWSGGLVFHEVQSDLEAEGYEVFSYVLPAASINAPHRRDRVFFIAHSNNNRFNGYDCKSEVESNIGGINAFDDINKMSCERSITDTECVRLEHSEETRNIREGKTKTQRQRSKPSESIETNGIQRITTDTSCSGLQGRKIKGDLGEKKRKGEYDRNITRQISNRWENFPTVPPICNGDDGISDRLDSITFSKWRKQTIMAGGNAVVPQLIYVLFKTIQQYESRTN